MEAAGGHRVGNSCDFCSLSMASSLVAAVKWDRPALKSGNDGREIFQTDCVYLPLPPARNFHGFY
jgi:hypothetical protein